MDAVILATIGDLRSVVHPIILMVLLVPMLVALVLWVGLGWAYWDAWTCVIQDAVVGHSHFAWAANWDIAGLASWITAMLVFALLGLVVIVTPFLMAARFAMPVLVRHVARLDYPNLAPRRRCTFFGTIWNPVAAL